MVALTQIICFYVGLFVYSSDDFNLDANTSALRRGYG